ncbi:hypothetical protein PYCC9005_003465 [Savitreella phatthalungensis]
MAKRGRPPGSKNKPKATTVPRKPYGSSRPRAQTSSEKQTQITSTARGERLVDKLRSEVRSRSVATVGVDDVAGWLAWYSGVDGNDWLARDGHPHACVTRFHRVETFGCATVVVPATTLDTLPDTPHGSLFDLNNQLSECPAILDVYHFHGDTLKFILTHGHHVHPPQRPLQILTHAQHEAGR